MPLHCPYFMKICIYLLLFVSVPAQSVENESVCDDYESCAALHVRKSMDSDLFSRRCELNSMKAVLAQKKFSYIHIPKGGGSSLGHYFTLTGGNRFVTNFHQPLLVVQSAHPDHTFATMLREPLYRYISFYNYVNSFDPLKPKMKINKFWNGSWRKDPVKVWTQDPVILDIMHNEVLYFLHTNSSRFSNPSPYFKEDMWYTALQKRSSSEKIQPLLTSDEQDRSAFVAYTQEIPEKFQCTEHMHIVYTLLELFPIVGVLEELSYMERSYENRMSVNVNKVDKEKENYHPKNVSKTHSIFTPEVIAQMRINLKDTIYCEDVLWKVAKQIARKDYGCLKT